MDLKKFDDLLHATGETLRQAYAGHPHWPWLEYMQKEARNHRRRLAYTIDLVAKLPGNVLDVGSNMIFSCMFAQLRKGTTTLINHGSAGRSELRFLDQLMPIHLIDIQRDPFPFADGTFDSIVFLEVIEHMSIDPMHAMAEINRVTRNDGQLLMSTPNIVSYRSIQAAIACQHPQLSSSYLPIDSTDRHNREYTPAELATMVTSSGYAIEWAATPSFYSEPENFENLARMLGESGKVETLRGDTIAIRGRKVGPVTTRHPSQIYM